MSDTSDSEQPEEEEPGTRPMYSGTPGHMPQADPDLEEYELDPDWEQQAPYEQPGRLIAGTRTGGIDIRVDDSFGELGEPMNAADALRVLQRRLRPTNDGKRTLKDMGYTVHNGAMWAELARRVLSIMPPEMVTEEIINNADLRPFLDSVQKSDDDRIDDDDKAIAAVLIQDQTDQIREKVEEQLIPRADDANAVQTANVIEQLVNAWAEGTVYKMDTLTPETGKLIVDPDDGSISATGDLATTQSATGLDISGILDQETSNMRQFMSDEEVGFMVRGDLDPTMAVDTLLAEDQMRRGGVDSQGNEITGWEGSQARVLYSDEDQYDKQKAMSMMPTGYAWAEEARATMEKPGTHYTVRQTQDLPSTMSREEVYILGKKMKNAGLMTEDMTDPSDSSDPAFKKAWKSLMGRALERNESMLSILDSMAKHRAEALEDSYATLLTDPAAIRLQSDAMGKQLLGRALQPDEQAQLIEFYHELERRNLKLQAGFDPNSENSLDELEGEAIQADLDARMNEWIRSENPEEAGGKDVADQYDVLTGLLAGPGAPGLVR